MQLKTKSYKSLPDDLINQINLLIYEHRAENSHYQPTLGGDIQSYCDCFNIRITVYTSDERFSFRPNNSLPSFLDAHLYSHPQIFSFDSVVSIKITNPRTTMLPEPTNLILRVSTWNVRGATDNIKRNMIDYELSERKITICLIQESHLWSHTLSTAHFKWVLGRQVQTRASRGVGFLIHHSISSEFTEVTFPHPNIAVLKVKLPQMSLPLFLINVHKCNDGDLLSGLETGILSTQIQDLRMNGYVVVAGDFNAHFGFEEESIKNSNLFGNILHHERSNNNGEELSMMCELNQLKVIITHYHRSTKITWSNSRTTSQLDHVLIPTTSKIILSNLQGAWSKVSTDHKLISWILKIPLTDALLPSIIYPANTTYYCKSWNLKSLSHESVKDAYESLFEECVKNYSAESLSWKEVSAIACYCAEKILKRRNTPVTEEQRVIYSNYQTSLKSVMRRRVIDINPNLSTSGLDHPPIPPPAAIRLLRASHKALVRSRHASSQNALNEFLESLQQQVPIPGQRTQLAFQYLKSVKRNTTQSCSASISLREWSFDLDKQRGNAINLLDEVESEIKLSHPKFLEIIEIIKSMKNGKTPGMDNVCVEMYKSSPTLCYQLHKIIKKAYLTNEIPFEWQQTYTIPIPKGKSPKSVDDYRKLTMCNIAYKVYSILLMKMIKLYLPPIDLYQTGFVKNRSCDDLNFVLRNLLDSRWNHGKFTSVISLDLKKAFDTVDISLIPEILLSHQTPKYLISRIITAVLTEFNCIKWKGESTHNVLKGIGIKQGCSVSPELFVYVLNEIIRKTKEELLSNGIILCTGSNDELLSLPLIQSYADDLYIICENIMEGILISEIFSKHAKYYGLSINCSKSKILIKGNDVITPASFQICNNPVPVVDSIKVLGTTLTSNMHRKSAIKPRVTSTINLFRALLPYLKNLKAPMDLLVKLHATILVPSLIYGLNISTMTKSNENTLMRRELFILKELSNIAYPRPPQSTIASLIDNRTINRKVSIGRIRYFYHVKRRNTGSLILQSLNYKDVSRRKIGRPIFDFHDSLKRDFSKYLELGIQQSDFEKDYELRDVIKNLSAQLYSRANLDDDPLPSDMKLYTDYELESLQM